MKKAKGYPLGRFRNLPATHKHHVSSSTYTVLGYGKWEPTCETVVIYQSKTTGIIWVRPRDAFNGTVNVGGKQVRRFQPIRSPAKKVHAKKNPASARRRTAGKGRTSRRRQPG